MRIGESVFSGKAQSAAVEGGTERPEHGVVGHKGQHPFLLAGPGRTRQETERAPKKRDHKDGRAKHGSAAAGRMA